MSEESNIFNNDSCVHIEDINLNDGTPINLSNEEKKMIMKKMIMKKNMIRKMKRNMKKKMKRKMKRTMKRKMKKKMKKKIKKFMEKKINYLCFHLGDINLNDGTPINLSKEEKKKIIKEVYEDCVCNGCASTSDTDKLIIAELIYTTMKLKLEEKKRNLDEQKRNLDEKKKKLEFRKIKEQILNETLFSGEEVPNDLWRQVEWEFYFIYATNPDYGTYKAYDYEILKKFGFPDNPRWMHNIMNLIHLIKNSERDFSNSPFLYFDIHIMIDNKLRTITYFEELLSANDPHLQKIHDFSALLDTIPDKTHPLHYVTRLDAAIQRKLKGYPTLPENVTIDEIDKIYFKHYLRTGQILEQDIKSRVCYAINLMISGEITSIPEFGYYDLDNYNDFIHFKATNLSLSNSIYLAYRPKYASKNYDKTKPINSYSNSLVISYTTDFIIEMIKNNFGINKNSRFMCSDRLYCAKQLGIWQDTIQKYMSKDMHKNTNDIHSFLKLTEKGSIF
tara:strand:+ start:1777 stop:3285 length:1509 start_codon:yes stop_codon:yes gene_type:complete